MEFIKEYIINITAVALCASLCTMIMPSGTYTKYVRLVCGLLLAVVMLKPIIGADQFDLAFDSLIPEEKVSQEGLQEEYDNIIVKAYKQRIETDVSQLDGVNRAVAEIRDNGEVSKVYIYVNGTGEEIRKYVREKYELPNEKIVIRTEGGTNG